MDRIVTPVKIENAIEPDKSILCNALVDTGAAHLVLPSAWKARLGKVASSQVVDMETATQDTINAEICGPVRLQIEGFRPIHTEVMFVEMHPADGSYEPLLGYIALEQSQAAVDMVGHRLVPVKRLDLK